MATALPRAPSEAATRRDATEFPLFSGDKVHLEITWDRARTGTVEVSARLQGPSIKIVWTEDKAQEKKRPSAPPSPAKVVRRASPLPVAVSRILVENGSALMVQGTSPDKQLIRVHGVALTVENFSTRRARSRGLPTLVTGRGRIGREGNLALFITLNPWTEKLNFAGRVQVLGLGLDELGGFVEQAVGLVPTQGTLSVFMQFSVQDGQLTGGVRPIATNVEVSPDERELLDLLKAWFAQGAIDLLSRDVGGEQRLATVVPLRGDLQEPAVDIWSALVGVIQRAFGQGINIGYQNLAPAKGSPR